MRPYVAIVLGYLVLVVASLLVLGALMGMLGTESILVPGQWRFKTWFAVVGPLLLVLPSALGGLTAVKVGCRMRPAMVLAAAVVLFGLVAGSTSVRSPDDYEDRRWTPKFTELIRRVREPLPAMVAGSLAMGGGVLLGGAMGLLHTAAGSRRASSKIRFRDPSN